jgi:hypothetical protein
VTLQKLVFKPGINRENTNYANESGWYEMDKVRFRQGTPEKIGGWRRAVDGTFSGVARHLSAWTTLAGETLIGIGTHTRFYLNYGGTYFNITPIRTTAEITNPLQTTVNSSVIKVFDAQHGAAPGDIVVLSNATTLAGISAATLNSVDGYRVTTVIDSNTYTIDPGVVAVSSTTGGGTLTITYELPASLPVFSSGTGWGAGYWNGALTGIGSTVLAGTTRLALNATDTTISVDSTTGFSASGTLLINSEIITYTGVTATTFTGCTRGANGSTAKNHARRQLAAQNFADIAVQQVLGYSGNTGWGASNTDVATSVALQMRLWSASTYGEDLILAPRGGEIYYWTKDVQNFTRAQVLRDPTHGVKKFIPHTVNAALVSDVSRFVLALGSNPYDPNDEGTTFDPMQIRWSAQDDPTVWIPDATNQAGDVRLSAGAHIMAGVPMKQELLVWTDAALYSMQYVGPPYVWRTELSMSNLSLMGPNAIAVVNNNAFWMGMDKFYIYNGRVDTLPCTLSQFVFTDIAFSQRFQTCAGTNEGFNEIWWHYVSNDELTLAAQEGRDPTCDRYVIYNHAEQVWYYGTLGRTAWLDTPLFPGPLAATGDSSTGVLVMHEQGTDNEAATTPEPIEAYIQSADFDIGDGHQFLFVWRVLPDVSFNGSVIPNPQAIMTLLPRQNPGANYTSSDSGTVQSTQLYSTNVKQYTVQQFTQQINTRVRGRQMALRIESSGFGVQWKLGMPRIDARPDGRKS